MKILLIFALSLSFLGLSCRTSDAGEASNLNTTNSAELPASTLAAPKVKIFTAVNLTEYVQRNGGELDKMLGGQKIMVSGAVKWLDNATVELVGSGAGTVTCTGAVFYQEEWKKLSAYYSDFNYKRAPRPMATVSGIYKTSVAPSAFLEDCKVETATK